MLDACDINHDGKISFEEFVAFCKETERELWRLFQAIDRDGSGKLDEREVKTAFERAGVVVEGGRLERFFRHVDANQDGEIDFGEWRGMYTLTPLSLSFKTR